MIRIATIGTSMITSSLLEVLKPNPRAVFVGTCSRDAQRAEAFTQAHGGDRGFSSVEDLAASSDVDAVYIGSPNAIHYSQALACVRAGKHVLVEKPVCANQRQAAELFDEATKHNVVALEAMRPLHDPALRQIRDALPRLGTIRRTTLRFGKYSSRWRAAAPTSSIAPWHPARLWTSASTAWSHWSPCLVSPKPCSAQRPFWTMTREASREAP